MGKCYEIKLLYVLLFILRDFFILQDQITLCFSKNQIFIVIILAVVPVYRFTEAFSEFARLVCETQLLSKKLAVVAGGQP